MGILLARLKIKCVNNSSLQLVPLEWVNNFNFSSQDQESILRARGKYNLLLLY